ncbi:MAG: AAA family ATPase, partial [Candidatus Ranarchaeia archaeon]
MKLKASEARKICDYEFIKCLIPETQKTLDGIIGQERAVKAIQFGLGMKSQGFNIFLAGKSGTGRTTAMRTFLKEFAKTMPTPSDWCYVDNFKDPFSPLTLELPAGKGREFEQDIDHFITDTKRVIPAVFESADYISRRIVVVREIEDRRDKVIKNLSDRAKEEGFLVQPTSAGVALIPIKDGKPMKQEEFIALPADVQKKYEEKRKKISTAFRKVMEQSKAVQREAVQAVQALDKEVGSFTIDTWVVELSKKYKDFPEVVKFIQSLKDDILKNLDLFRSQQPTQTGAAVGGPGSSGGRPTRGSAAEEYLFRRYHVNVVIDNSDIKGAPVVYEHNPTHNNLLGTIEREAVLGALTTDFTLIRSGALQRSNGGFLVLPAEVLVSNGIAYEGLKRAIRNEVIRIEEIGRELSLVTTKSLSPQPIPFNAKVILIGEQRTYQILHSLDQDFPELFKVKAEFDT